MIDSFADKRAAAIWRGELPKGFPVQIAQTVRRKLRMIHAAQNVQDLRAPPGNRLEALQGDRAGQYSIRVNAQFRICFIWRDGKAHQVEIVDYH
ncbi:type II toxin-antitoxin system RelE/ParE family toxin [Acetobacteraceae bacterium ESL0709]|nr:type II toxin-antitoxin system RelE/ParE family toxin [Acetobacteraceae bacterium ESL0697]MDF7677388.1 type II toxin-antitoxin system RelE/ParE family toxin [Acetobacteraceae bacterium ESL0709]